MTKPLISVIVPVYNVEKYLPMCLNSILAQTFKDFEVVCVDDGSTDNGLAILQEYAQKDKRIKVIHQENQGLVGARNSGVRVARGEYLYFVDSDDRIHPQLLEICLDLSQKEKADWVCFQMENMCMEQTPEIKKYDTRNLNYVVTNDPLLYCKAQNLFELGFSVWSKLYLKEFYARHPFDMKIYFEDYPQTLDFCSEHPKTVILSLPLYFYTQNQASISRANFSVKKIKDYHKGINYVYEIYKNRPAELKTVVYNVFGRILKRQLSLIKHSEKSVQKELLKAFAEELCDLWGKGCVRLKGSKLKNYLKYRFLIFKENREKNKQ